MPMSALEARRAPAGRQAPGECRLSKRDGQLYIERADPKVWLEDEFLHQLVGPGHINEWVSLAYQEHDVCQPMRCCQRYRAERHCYYGALITIRGSNKTITYRIFGFLRGGFWEAALA